MVDRSAKGRGRSVRSDGPPLCAPYLPDGARCEWRSDRAACRDGAGEAQGPEDLSEVRAHGTAPCEARAAGGGGEDTREGEERGRFEMTVPHCASWRPP